MEETNTLFSISDLIQVPAKKESKFKFEFQELCSEMEPLFGKVVWSLPYKPGFTESKLRRAFEICKTKGILKVGYLIGCVRNDKGL